MVSMFFSLFIFHKIFYTNVCTVSANEYLYFFNLRLFIADIELKVGGDLYDLHGG